MMLGSELRGGFANRNHIFFSWKKCQGNRDSSVKAFFLMIPLISLNSHLQHAFLERGIHLSRSSERSVLRLTTNKKAVL